MPGHLFVLTGPSGVGKTTVAHELLNRQANLSRLVTYTTRPPRPNEEHGVDYHFIAIADFERMIKDGEMFEWAKVYDRYYGNRESDLNVLLKQGRDVLMVVDVQGAKTIKEKRTDAYLIFLAAASPEILLERISRRDPSKIAEIERRKNALPEEMRFSTECQAIITGRDGDIEGTVAEVETRMREHAKEVS